MHQQNTLSQERPNVIAIRALYDAFARRDAAAVMGMFSPDIEIFQSPELAYGGTYRGVAGATEFFTKLTTAITSTPVVDRFIDSGEHVTAVGFTKGTANAGGKPFEIAFAHVWELRDGKVVSARFFVHNPAITAALGL